MKPVLFLDTCLSFGGDSQVLLDMLSQIDSRRFRPFVAVNANGVLGQRLRKRNHIELIDCDFGQTGRALRRLFSLVKTVVRLLFVIAVERIQVVHVNNPISGRTTLTAFALKLLTLGRIKLVFHAHCDTGSSRHTKLLARASSEIWSISDFITDHYKNLGVKENRIRPMPNCNAFREIYPAAGLQVRRKFNLCSRDLLFVHVGRLSPTKGQDITLEAFAFACGKREDCYLLFVGDDSLADGNDGFVARLKARCRELQIEHRVFFAGFSRDTDAYYASADLVLVPSRSEPFGLVFLEAANALTPVLVSDVGGLHEVASQTAKLTTYSPNPEAFAAGMRDFLTGELSQDTRKTRERLRAAYSEQAFRTRLNHAFTELLDPESTDTRLATVSDSKGLSS